MTAGIHTPVYLYRLTDKPIHVRQAYEIPLVTYSSLTDLFFCGTGTGGGGMANLSSTVLDTMAPTMGSNLTYSESRVSDGVILDSAMPI